MESTITISHLAAAIVTSLLVGAVIGASVVAWMYRGGAR